MGETDVPRELDVELNVDSLSLYSSELGIQPSSFFLI